MENKTIEIDALDADIICTALYVAEHESMVDQDAMERITNIIRKVFPEVFDEPESYTWEQWNNE